MGSETLSQELCGAKRKLDCLELDEGDESPSKHSAAAHLCRQCEEDVPRFKDALYTHNSSVLTLKGEHVSSRTWPVEGVNSQCRLCPLFLPKDVREKFGTQKDQDSVTFNIHEASFLKCIGEIEHFNAKLPDSVCLAAYLYSNSGNEEDPGDDDDKVSRSVVVPALTCPKNFHDKQMVHSSDSSQKYAARVVDSSSFDRDLVSSWIQTCKIAHKGKCSPGTGRIDARMPGNTQTLWVIDCQTRLLRAAKIHQQYLTLSYVWGTKNSHAKSPWKHEEKAELPANLPQTIEDAITVTLALSYRYLWVDYYCINQASEKDKAAQIAIMDLIYMASDLTIVAAAGDDSDSGLPGVGRLTRTPQNHLKIDDELTLVSHLDHPHDSIYTSIWNSRGWTFQEGMLAKRRVVFTKEQVYFECQCISTWESLRRPLARLASTQTKRIMPGVRAGFFQNRCGGEKDNFKHQGSRSNEVLFAEGLKTFLNRRLSFEGDILNAFQGFVEALYHRSNAYGLPLLLLEGDTADDQTADSQEAESSEMAVQLIRALYWEYSADGSSTRRPAFPSFSWAGWTGQPVFRLSDTFHATSNMAVFPDLEWEELTENAPKSLVVEGFVSRVALRCQYGGLRLRYLLPGMGVADAAHIELSRPVYGEGQKVTLGKKSVVEKQLGILFLALSKTKNRSWLKFLLFERKDGFAERCGTLAWALEDDLDGTEDTAPIEELEPFLDFPWKREVVTFL